MKYETWEKAIVLSLFVYLVVGSVYKFLPAHHLYPFFSWDLYSTIPNNFSVYDIRFYELNGKKYNPPVSYKEIFPKELHRNFFTIAIDLSVTFKSGNKSRIEASKSDFNKMLPVGIKAYELVELVYTPFGYKNGELPIKENNLGRFTIR